LQGWHPKGLIKTLELLIVLAVALLVFGSKTLPGLAQRMGREINEFRRGIGGSSDGRDTNPTDKHGGG
jgi:TatA/E family protein of Tat protein translocase